jgi:response regulator NasT
MTPSPPLGTTPERGLRVLLADEDDRKLERLSDVLQRLGHEVTPFAVSVSEAAEIIAREDPDLAIVAVHEDDEHALALIGEAVEYAAGPVIAQVPGGDTAFIARAAEHGISAWVGSEEANAVQAAIEVAMRHYREAKQLSEKVEQLQTALERRAIIERAKGIIMERHSVGEREAFELLRDRSRSASQRVVDTSQAVVDGHALLPRDP